MAPSSTTQQTKHRAASQPTMKGALAHKPSINILFFVLLISHSHFGSPKTVLNPKTPCKRMVLYYHNTMFDGNNVGNATASMIAFPNGTGLGHFLFGRTVVFDDPVTLQDDHRIPDPPFARAQGFYFYNMKTTYNAWFGYSLVFNSTEYRGTLNIMGADIIDEETRDLSVVGGTGDFFMARGIVTLRLQEIIDYDYFRLRMDVKLYECY